MTVMNVPLPAAGVPPVAPNGETAASGAAEPGAGFADLVTALLALDARAAPQPAPGAATDEQPAEEPSTEDAPDEATDPTDPGAAVLHPEPPAVPVSLSGTAGVPTVVPAVGPTGPDAPCPAAAGPAPSGPEPGARTVPPEGPVGHAPRAASTAPSGGSAAPAPTQAPSPTPESPAAPAPTADAPTAPAPTADAVPVAAAVPPVPAGATGPGGLELSDAGRQVGPVLVRVVESAPARPGTQRVTLQLHPADLGEVRATISLRGDGGLRVALAAGPEARELLRQDHPALRHLLEQTGADRVEIAVRTLPTTHDRPDPVAPGATAQQSGDRPTGFGPGHQPGHPGHQPGQPGQPGQQPGRPAAATPRPGGSPEPNPPLDADTGRGRAGLDVTV